MIFYNQNNVIDPFRSWDAPTPAKGIHYKLSSSPMIGAKDAIDGPHLVVGPNVVLNQYGREEYITFRETVIMNVIDDEL